MRTYLSLCAHKSATTGSLHIAHGRVSLLLHTVMFLSSSKQTVERVHEKRFVPSASVALRVAYRLVSTGLRQGVKHGEH